MINKKIIFAGGVMILFFLGIAYAISQNFSTDEGDSNQESSLIIQVDIPCPGHAFIIENSLDIDGVASVDFKVPNYFSVKYDPSKITKERILDLKIFDEYPAKEVVA